MRVVGDGALGGVGLSHMEVFAEINFLRKRIVDYFILASRNANLPLTHDVGSVGDFQSVPNIVIRNQNADSATGEEFYHFLYVRDRNRVDSGERLVKEQEFRLNLYAGCLRMFPIENSSIKFSRYCFFSERDKSFLVSRIDQMFSSTVSFLKTLGSCGR